MVDRAWDFWIDRGGTFTDVVARTPSGQLRTLKLLSADPQRYEDAAVAAIERLLAESPPDERRIGAVKMGTTVATNALLERRGEPTVLVITAGLEDAIRIGGQQRPDIFALDIKLPEMLYARVVGAAERIGANGEVLEPLDTDKLRADLKAAFDAELRSVAIVLLHGYRFPQHEARGRRDRARDWLRASLRVASSAAAAEARHARRHDARGRIPVAGARPLRRERAARAR